MRSSFFVRVLRNRHLLIYCVESAMELAVCKVRTVFLPFRRWNRSHGYFQSETLKENMLPERFRILAIRYSIQLTARCVPWHSKCLDQALAAQHMLGRRRLQSTLYYGMMRDEKKKWLAHAWIRCGDQWVVGYQPDTHYTVVGTFAQIP